MWAKTAHTADHSQFPCGYGTGKISSDIMRGKKRQVCSMGEAKNLPEGTHFIQPMMETKPSHN